MSTKICFLSVSAGLLLGLTVQAAEIRGVVLKTDTEKNQLTIEGRGLGVRGLIMTFQLDKETPIQALGRKPIKRTDLTPGKRVRVAYEMQGDRHVALLVTLLGPAPSSSSTEAALSSGIAISGMLRRVSFTEREIVVISPASKGEGEVETTLSVPEDAKITKDQKPISLDDLKEGEQVLVQAEKRNGKLVAKSIQLGVAANVKPNPEPTQDKIKKLRSALKMLDFFLQMMEQKSH